MKTLAYALPFAAVAVAIPLACSSSSENQATATSSSAASSSTGHGGATSTSSAGGAGGGTTSAGGSGGAGPIGGDRPVSVHVPPTYDPAHPMPLVILLHGYSASGSLQEAYMQFTPLSDSRGFLYAYPDGTVDNQGEHFWNATDACCNFNGSKVDDSAYLSMVVDQIKQRFAVDPKRVFFIGHSNGGFMSYRMACEHSDAIAAIAVLAGEMWEDTSKCTPANPVSVLHIQGTADATISYMGGSILGNMYPGAMQSVEDWVKIDGCTDSPVMGTPKDLDSTLAGDETTVQTWSMGCKPGGGTELWTIQGGGHLPSLSMQFSPSVIDFLFAHPKP